VRANGGVGVKFDELQRLLPNVGRIQIQRLLRELREEGLVEKRGETKAARWFRATDVAIPE
jgi:DNA-binding HxlR family transcriptional regulator